MTRYLASNAFTLRNVLCLAVLVFLVFSFPAESQSSVFLPAVSYSTGGKGATAVAAADLNGDGIVDVVVVNYDSETIGVLMGVGDGTLMAPVLYPLLYDVESVVIADVNGDHVPDLVAWAPEGGPYSFVAVLLGNGDGTFRPAVFYSAGGYQFWGISLPLVVADVNGDGKPDVIVPNECDGASASCENGSVGILLGNGDGTFQPAVTYASGGYLAGDVIVADLNADGKADLVVSNCAALGKTRCKGNGVMGILLGNGDGTFRSATTYLTGSPEFFFSPLVAADLNGDGKLDLVIGNYNGGAGVFRQRSNGTFAARKIYRTDTGEVAAVAVADLNHDGKPDLVLTSFGQSISVLLGNGNGTFQPAVTYDFGGVNYNLSTFVADVNGDGIPDAVVTTFGPAEVLLGNGDGSLQLAQSYETGAGPYVGLGPASVLVDLNGDGRPDLLTVSDDQLGVLLNSGGGSLAVADLNGDGKPDVVVENPLQNTVAVLLKGVAAPTKTHLEVSPGKCEIGQPVTFTAQVTTRRGTPPDGGDVSFSSGGTVLGTSTLSGGVATLVTSSLPVGTSLISASYAGAPGFTASTSGRHRVVVRKIPVGITISSSLDPSPWGAPVTFTAVLTPESGTIPDGESVAFIDDYHFSLGAGVIANGVATITTSHFRIRNSIVWADYPGDSQFAKSGVITFQYVKKGSSSMTVSSSPNPSQVGQTVTFTAVVTSPDGCPISGGVEFSGVGLAKVDQSGVATITKTMINPGSHTIEAHYGGTANCEHNDETLIQVVQ